MYIKKEAQELYGELEKRLNIYLKEYDNKLLKRAFKYAYEKHGDQKTLCGKPYIMHLLGTSIRLAELHADFYSIIAGLLHDIVRDTSVKISNIEKLFGKEISKIVNGVTTLSELEYSDGMTTRDLSFLKEIFKMGGKDVRVLLIKISDRIDFIKSIEHLPEERRKVKSKETLDIYVPMIKLFGIGKYIGNVEDLCYRYLEPQEFNRLDSILSGKKESLKKKIEDYKNVIFQSLIDKHISSDIEGRIKTVYSISKKIQRKHIPFSGIYDLIALRVIVSTKKDCYITLSVIHSLFKSKENRIKDYISAPKPNGYQSLHTTISDSEGFHFEIQIQTKQMYRYNMFGLASHNSYKGFSSDHTSFPRWMKKLLKQQKKSIFGENFIDQINPHSLKETIICTTPKGKEIELPEKSTILDFAFKIHSDFGKKTIGAWVNNEYIEDLVYILNDGDQVRLSLGNEESNYPVSYLSYLKTDGARKSLKKVFKNKSEYKRSLLGKHLINERMELLGYKPYALLPGIIQKEVEADFGVDDSNSLYLEIGGGNIDADKVINEIYEKKNDDEKYKTIVSLKISFKKKDTKNIHALFDLFHNLDINIISAHYRGHYVYTDINVKNLQILYELSAETSRLPNVSQVKRRFTKRVWIFLAVLSLVSLIIVLSPGILFVIGKVFHIGEVAYKTMLYVSGVSFIFLLYFFKHMARETLPGLIKRRIFWVGMFLLNTFILATVIWESIYIFDSGSGVFFFSLSMLLYGLTIFEYLDSKIENSKNNY